MTAPPGATQPSPVERTWRPRRTSDPNAPPSARRRGTPYRRLAWVGLVVLGLGVAFALPTLAVGSVSAFSVHPASTGPAAPRAFDGSGNGSDDGGGSGSGGGNGSGSSGGLSGNGTGSVTNSTGGTNSTGTGSDNGSGVLAPGAAPLAPAGSAGSSILSVHELGVPIVLGALGVLGSVVVYSDLRARRGRPPARSPGA